MIDYLFVSPLGWSHYIWDRLIDRLGISSDQYDFIEFLDSSLPSINRKEMDKKMKGKIVNPSSYRTIVTSSFGTVVLLDYLESTGIQVKNLVIIDGLSDIPEEDELKEMGLDSDPEVFKSKESHIHSLLEEEDSYDGEILEILSKNVDQLETGYQVKLSNGNLLQYLSLYSGKQPLEILKRLVDLGHIENLKLFSVSELEGDFDYVKIEAAEHLLMLLAPEKLLDELEQ